MKALLSAGRLRPASFVLAARRTARLATVLLSSTWLTPWFAAAAAIAAFGPAVPAWADGGAGGGRSESGGPGGTGFDGNPGGDGSQGVHTTGGGGGGAAVSTTGGQGGNGAGPGGGTGGAGGSILNSAGSNGGDAGSGGFGGGGGGGGGFNGNGAGAATLNNAAPLSGGSGGNGGNPVGAGGAGSSGGGGGGGGYGAIVTSGGASNNTGAITGGAGGAGAPGVGAGSGNGSGGDGGVGVQFTTSGASFTNTGSIVGGNGGAAGNAGGSVPGNPGVGGAGIVGGGLTVINSGGITGGANGDGSVQANAVTFTGGANIFELQSNTSSITGNVVAFSSADTLRLGGSANLTFDTTQIAAAGHYQNFGIFVKTGTGTWTLTGTPGQATPWTINQGTLAISSDNNLGTSGETLSFNGGTLQALGGFATSRPISLNGGGGTIDTNGFQVQVGSSIGGTGGFTKAGNGTLIFAAPMTYAGGTTVNAGVLELIGGSSLNSAGALTVNGGTFDMSQLGANQTVGALSGTGGIIALGNNTLVTNSAANTTLASQITDGGIGGGTGASLIKQGTGILTLRGANTYTGGMTISGGMINFATANNFGTGGITLNGGGLQWATGNTTDISSKLAPLGAGGGIFDTNGNNVIFASGLSGPGGLTKQGNGMLSLNGTNTYTGPTTIAGGTLAVNGSLAGTVTINSGGTIGGNGTLGGVMSNGGTLAPGNSIGTLTVSGNLAQNGGTYQVEANAAGQSDRINVGGTATISNGAAVQVLAQPGNYGRSTIYTILRANGGVSGTYSGVSSNFAFLTPSLSYDANDVFLTLSMAENAFSFGGRTYNQRQVGRTLDQTFNGASGDYATVLNAIAGLGTANGPQTLDAISGQNYAGFGNAMVQGAQLFLSNFANRAGSRSGGGTRVALAEACDVACDATTPALWGAWGGAVGGTGTIAGNDNAGTFTYSVGGFSGGLDRRFGDNFLAGITVGYQTGGQWTGGFDGRSVTDSVQAGLYASFLQGPLYVDAVAAYAYSSNQLWRPINIAGLQPRTAYGQAGANQFLGQIEAGWRFDLGGAAGYFITPFALLQGSTATQNGLTETGAQSLNLSVAQQTTSSLRTIFGAQLGASMDLGLRDRIAAQLRLGWSHEYSDTARPVTASFAGAPAVPFTVFGAAPTRDGAVLGFSVSTAVAEAMGVYLRYEGTIAGQDSSHALIAGLRMSW